MRWGDLEAAEVFVDPELREEFKEAAKEIPPEMLAEADFNNTGQSGVKQLFALVTRVSCEVG